MNKTKKCDEKRVHHSFTQQINKTSAMTKVSVSRNTKGTKAATMLEEVFSGIAWNG